MARVVAYRGVRYTVAFAREAGGGCPGCEFFDGLALQDRAKLMALFRIAGDYAQFHNPEKFGALGGGLFEFKSYQIRMPFAYSKRERGVIVVTHGFIKKGRKAPKEEIARAWRILAEDDGQTRLTVIRRDGR